MKKKKLFFLFLISFFLISGCGSHEDCSLKDSTYVKYSWNDDIGKCIAKKIQKNLPNNGIIEEGETYCNAPKDVPKDHPEFGCSGTLGKYLEKKCVNDECVLTQNKLVKDITKELEFKNSDLILKGKFKLKTPFILNTQDNNKVSVSLSFFNEVSPVKKVSNLKIKKLMILNSASEILIEHPFEKILPKIESSTKTVNLPLAETTAYDKRESLKVQLVISYFLTIYDSKGEVLKGPDEIKTTLTSSIGYWNIINPDFYEEK